MTTAAGRKYRELLDAIADDVSPALESVDFAGLIDQLVAWSEKQKLALEQRHNASRTTLSYAIPENDVLLWRVAPRLKDGAKVEILPAIRRSSRRVLVRHSSGCWKRFLTVLSTALKAARTL
jgi:hypothetical protein